MSRVVIQHFHLYKNAGTTIDWVLEKNFKEKLLKFDGPTSDYKYSRQEIENIIEENTDKIAFSCHQMVFPPASNHDCQVFPIIFLRHPVDRIGSIYDFEKNYHHNPENPEVKSMTMSEYINMRLKVHLGTTLINFQTRILSGKEHDLSNGVITEELFLKAVKRLQNSPFIGLVEKIEQSLVVLEENLKEFFPKIDLAFVSKNVNHKRRKDPLEKRLVEIKKQLSNELWLKINNDNFYDFTLYKIAEIKLNKQILKINNFDYKLEDFKSRCLEITKKNQNGLDLQ